MAAINNRSGHPNQCPAPLGVARSTLAGDISALNLWVAFRKACVSPEDVTPEELEGDGAESLITELCRWASSRPIPLSFDDNLQRKKSKTGTKCNRLLQPVTLVKYVGKHIKYFCKVYPDHPDWKHLNPNRQDAVPQWWTELKPLFLKSARNFMLQYQGDGVFGVNDIKPLYQDLGLDDNNGSEPLLVCDQKHIAIGLVKKAANTNNNLQMLAIIHSVADAIGRGGEAKSQTFRDWSFDYSWNVTNTPWKEKKTIQGYAMPRVADERWYADWYLSMGMYCMCEKGLYRTPQAINAGLLLAVFPLLHGKNDEYCSEKITNVIRSVLPTDVRDQFSSKSLRQAGISQCAKHPHMTIFHLSALSGHSTQTTADSYLDRDDVGRGVPAINALHKKKNLFTPIVKPSLDSLGSDKKSALKLMGVMFQCNIYKFKKGKELYPVMETFAASLIMHYPQLERDCGASNRVCSMLLDHATKVGITCSAAIDLPPDQILHRWAETIMSDYRNKSKFASISVMDEPGQEVYAAVATLADCVKSIEVTNKALASKVERMSAQFDGLMRQHAADQSIISTLHRTNEDLRQKLNRMYDNDSLHTQQLLLTPQGGKSRRKRKRRRRGSPDQSPEQSPVIDNDADNSLGTRNEDALAVNNEGPDTEDVLTGEPIETDGRTIAGHTTQARRTLRFGHDGAQVASGASDSMKRKMFADALIFLGQNGSLRMHSKLELASIPTTLVSEQSLLVNCLQLADYVGMDNEQIRNNIQILRSATRASDNIEIHDAANILVHACEDKLNEFVPPAGKRRPEPTIAGMGARIKSYKKRIKAAKKSKEKPNKIRLISLEDLKRLEPGEN